MSSLAYKPLTFANGETKELKFITGKIKWPVYVTRENEKMWFDYEFHGGIKDELKIVMNKIKWHGFDQKPIKKWSAAYNRHNLFQLEFMCGMNPYLPYQGELLDFSTWRDDKRMKHQYRMTQEMITRHYCINAGEMGTGKTFAAIEAMEWAAMKYGFHHRFWWVGPKSTLPAVKIDFEKWNCAVIPEFISYNSLQKKLSEHSGAAPLFVVFDESNKLKTGTAQRTQAAEYLADNIRMEYGQNGFVVEMCGTPAPKSPLDWYSQCEIACPGFIKEGDIHKFKNRLAIIEQKESLAGGVYPEVVSWLDDENKCADCGQKQDHFKHTQHKFRKSKNEVAFLYDRMKGLVHTTFKKDCLDLPDKHYRIIECKPTKELLRAANLIKARSPRAITALTLMRELSDGFQYEEKETGSVTCELCLGNKKTEQLFYTGPEVTKAFLIELGIWDASIDLYPDESLVSTIEFPQYYTKEWQACPNCAGTGLQKTYDRSITEVPCPKEDALIELAEEYSDVGRMVTYAGFTGSVDRCVRIFQTQKWKYIRVDGRGWHSDIAGTPEDLLKYFQDKSKKENIAFIAQGGAASMGLTLTASPVIVYYSNDFNADSRMQSEDRIHRVGMDVNRGATIIDLFHLPTDKYVYDNLKKKRDLQSLSMGLLNKMLGESLNV